MTCFVENCGQNVGTAGRVPNAAEPGVTVVYSPGSHRRQSPTVGAASAWMGNTVIASRSIVRT